jgi:hypothetical protein
VSSIQSPPLLEMHVLRQYIRSEAVEDWVSEELGGRRELRDII